MALISLTGSTAQSDATATTPLIDGSIRGTFGLIVAAVVGGICKALDLSDGDTAQVMALVAPVLIFCLGIFDKVVAPRLK